MAVTVGVQDSALIAYTRTSDEPKFSFPDSTYRLSSSGQGSGSTEKREETFLT